MVDVDVDGVTDDRIPPPRPRSLRPSGGPLCAPPTYMTFAGL